MSDEPISRQPAALPSSARDPRAPGTATGVGRVTLHRMVLVDDPRGTLSAGEVGAPIPFVTKRYFMVFDVPAADVRGEHAHRRCQQFLVCARGSVTVGIDDAATRAEVILDAPDLGLYLPPMIWAAQYKYSADALLLVFASDLYDPADYIRDYAEFRTLAAR